MSKTTIRIIFTALVLITTLVSTTGNGYAQESGEPIQIAGSTAIACATVTFTFNWAEGSPPYKVSLDYGDGDHSGIIDVSGNSFSIAHDYPDQGEYEWNFFVAEASLTGLSGSLSEILFLEGPEVTLSSSPFPPLFVVGDSGEVDFTTAVTGGELPYSYEWDFDGDGVFEGNADEIASYSYSEIGKYYPQVLVTDSCGFTASDTIPVVVADPENACHPAAQKIADGVNTIFPDQSDDLYTCEDVYALFENESEENNLGFGRMWKAYHLAESMEELTWEDILDWHLDQSGWGSLLQLDRFADLLEEHDLPELMGLVISEEYSLGDVRTAVRAATRYEADFEDALSRILEGANTGELTQFYKLAADLEAEVEVLDEYLADGLTLSELRHTSKFADRMEVDWTEVADARSEADNWGELNQAYRLATDEISAAEILIIGVQEYKETVKGEAKVEGDEQKQEKEEEKNQQTAEKLAEQFSAEFGDVINLLNGECQGDWACVRSTLRDQKRSMDQELSEKDIQTALQIAAKYGFTDFEVTEHYENFCDFDWACTRAYFRELYMSTKENGKSKK